MTLMTSSQALQASALVGQNVLLPRAISGLSGKGWFSVNGRCCWQWVSRYKYSNVKITVEDEKGQVIKEFPSGR